MGEVIPGRTLRVRVLTHRSMQLHDRWGFDAAVGRHVTAHIEAAAAAGCAGRAATAADLHHDRGAHRQSHSARLHGFTASIADRVDGHVVAIVVIYAMKGWRHGPAAVDAWP